MEPELISKKDLLAATGISYGQLYRWKRKGLIPEEWFVRKATFTGQETFFPRDKMLARVERILSMKGEELSLDDIAEAVQPDFTGMSVSVDEAVALGAVSASTAEMLGGARPELSTLRFGELLSVYVADLMLRAGDVTSAEAALVVETLLDTLPEREKRDLDVIVVRKMGVALCVLIPAGASVEFDASTRVVTRVNIQESTDALGVRLKREEENNG